MAKRPGTRQAQLEAEMNEDGDTEDTSLVPDSADDPNLEGFPEDGDTYDGSNPAPEFEEVTVGGRTFTVLKGQGAELESSYEELISSRQEPSPVPAPTPTPTPQVEPQEDDDFESQFFENPQQFLSKFRTDIKEEVRKELTAEYQQENARNEFWNNFYSENPDIRDEQTIVRAVMEENFDTLGGMKGKAARDELAKMTKRKILDLSTKLSGGKRSALPEESLEGGRTNARPQKARQEDKVPSSLSAGIKARKAARAQRRNLLSNQE